MRPVVLTTASPAKSGQLDNAAGRVVWLSLRETTGAAAAAVRLWDGSSTGGKRLVSVALAQGTSSSVFPGFHSLPYETGLYLEVVTGTVEGTVVIVPESEWPAADGLPVVVVAPVVLATPTAGG